MKGLLFTELLEMVEEDFGYGTANAIVLNSRLSSRGIYTASRSYHRSEMSRLFEQLQRQTKLPFEQLSAAFGRRLCRQMLSAYPQHTAYVNRILRLVGKRQTPVFQFSQTNDAQLTVVYNPTAKSICLTEGMVKGYLEHLHQTGRAEETTLPCGKRKFVLPLN